ncbi:LysR family transcriptional regulator [Pseudorhodoplanes sp.]|uniref:LysR family transcriptional regulator n=1 Tax=Pseudorhodoplanes sp. TaxID=1934341 RepID=UPI002CA9E86C|nr:LysR family transcriptional regulator [Pseudorhodoplanes sp.]HWV52304.1 LysR family transcriptional regulator [Pseudorhodoplanes sp.]
MINIPTELLRTLVAVVDLRSFTKAAISLGVTQPAVSAQIKRLQTLLDLELLDKSAPGVSLTHSGELVVNYARRMLSINDQIVDMSAPRLGSRALRIGIPGDFLTPNLPRLLTEFRTRYPDVRVSIRSDHFEAMSRDLRQGDLNLLVGLSETGIELDACHQWPEPIGWVRSPSFKLDPDAPVPLVTLGEGWAVHRAAVAALSRAQRGFEVVFVGQSKASVVEAVRHGMGVAALARRRIDIPGIALWDDAPLPPLPPLHCGIYLGETGQLPQLAALADLVFDVVGPKPDCVETPPLEPIGAVVEI